jgi:hypothetical protein
MTSEDDESSVERGEEERGQALRGMTRVPALCITDHEA